MSYNRVTLSTILTRLTGRVGNNSTFWTQDEKVMAINEALRIWQALTGEWRAEFAFDALGGNYVNVPQQIVSVDRVLYNGTPLSLTSIWELDKGTPGWEGTAGTPLEWAPFGLNQVALYPGPASGSIKLEGVAELLPLTGLAEYIDIGDEELTKLLGYAQHYLAFKEGLPESKATEEDFVAFMEAAVLKNGRLVGSELYRRFMGESRDENQRPLESGQPVVGVRG
jgi:hypothetical protein